MKVEPTQQELRFSEIADKIIKTQGLTFALACGLGKDIYTARGMLKEAIVKALMEAARTK